MAEKRRKAKAAQHIPGPPEEKPITWKESDYPVEVRREVATVEYECWYGAGHGADRPGLVRLLDSTGHVSGYVILRPDVRVPHVAGASEAKPYVVIDQVPEQLPFLLALLSARGDKSIHFRQADSHSAPFAAVCLKA